MVGHLMHYHPAVEQMKHMVAEGMLGKIHYIYANRLNLGRFHNEENVLWDLAPHDISVINAIIGSLPERVSASGRALSPPGVVDTVQTTFHYAAGELAAVFISWLHPFKEQRLVVAGKKGILVFDDAKPENKLRFFAEPARWNGQGYELSPGEGEPVGYAADEPLKKECRHFLDCVANRRKPLTDGWEGHRVVKVLCACQESLDNGGEWRNI